MKRAFALLIVLAAPAAFASTGPNVEPASARAWAVRVAGLLELGDVAADGGRAPGATAAAWSVAGSHPSRVTATRETPDAVSTPFTWTDQTGSISTEGGFAEAHVSGASASARAGLGSMTATGFAMADELFTWEQQEQLLTQWTEAMDAIVGPLNDALRTIEIPGLELPRLEGVPALGFVDFASGRQLASSADATSEPGYASARASATIGHLKLLGGFIEADNVSADAVSSGVAGGDTRRASARIGRLKVAGVEITADADGLHVAGNLPLARQAAFDQLLAVLAAAGVRIHALDVRSDGDLREAAALQIEIPGGLLISLAHAEASAPAVPLQGAPPALPEPTPERRISRGETEVLASAPKPAPAAPAVAASAAAGRSTRTTVVRRVTDPASAARAMRTAYLVLAAGGLLVAFVPPLLITRKEPS